MPGKLARPTDDLRRRRAPAVSAAAATAQRVGRVVAAGERQADVPTGSRAGRADDLDSRSRRGPRRSIRPSSASAEPVGADSSAIPRAQRRAAAGATATRANATIRPGPVGEPLARGSTTPASSRLRDQRARPGPRPDPAPRTPRAPPRGPRTRPGGPTRPWSARPRPGGRRRSCRRTRRPRPRTARPSPRRAVAGDPARSAPRAAAPRRTPPGPCPPAASTWTSQPEVVLLPCVPATATSVRPAAASATTCCHGSSGMPGRAPPRSSGGPGRSP